MVWAKLFWCMQWHSVAVIDAVCYPSFFHFGWVRKLCDSLINDMGMVEQTNRLMDHCRCAKGVHIVWRSLQVCRRCPCCLMITVDVQKVSMLFDNRCRCTKGVHVVWWSLQVCKRYPCCMTNSAGVQKVSMLSDDPCRCANGVDVVWKRFPNHLTGFDYRPYVLCCCPSLQVLDGYILSEGERWVGSARSPSSPPDDLVVVHVYIMCMYFTLNNDNRGYFWIMITGGISGTPYQMNSKCLQRAQLLC